MISQNIGVDSCSTHTARQVRHGHDLKPDITSLQSAGTKNVRSFQQGTNKSRTGLLKWVFPTHGVATNLVHSVLFAVSLPVRTAYLETGYPWKKEVVNRDAYV